jgi:hypothetical protein
MADQEKLQFQVEVSTTGNGAGQAAKDLENLAGASDKAAKSTTSLTSIIGKLGLSLLAYQELRKAINSFLDYDQAVLRLNGSLRAASQFSDAYSKSLTDLAGSIAKLTNTSKTQIIAAEAQLVSMGATSSEMQRLLKAATDLSAGMGKDLTSSVNILSQALQGNFNGFEKYGIKVNDNASRTAKFESVLAQIEKRFGGIASTSSTATSEISKLGNSFSNMAQGVGSEIVKLANTMAGYTNVAVDFWKNYLGLNYPSAQLNKPLPQPAAAALPADRLLDPAAAQRTRDLLDAQIELQRARDFGGPGTFGARGGNTRLSWTANSEAFDQRIGLLGRQNEGGLISNSDYEQLMAQLMQQADMSQANLGRAGAAVAGKYAVSPKERQLNEVRQQYTEMRDLVTSYYEYELELAGDSAEKIKTLSTEKTTVLKNLDKEQRQSLSETYQMYKQIGEYAATQFAGGMSRAFVDVIRGTKDAGTAFKEFAADFLAQIAQMIMQMLILKALKGVFGMSEGGTAMAMASGGMLMAANGLAGVQSVSSPTYLPKFNVLAGEAGPEMLTVLARPTMAQIGNLSYISGSAQGNKLAIAQESQLKQLSGGMGGAAVIQVNLAPGLKADLVQSSISGAVLQVTNDLSSDTPVASAVKSLTK